MIGKRAGRADLTIAAVMRLVRCGLAPISSELGRLLNVERGLYAPNATGRARPYPRATGALGARPVRAAKIGGYIVTLFRIGILFSRRMQMTSNQHDNDDVKSLRTAVEAVHRVNIETGWALAYRVHGKRP